MGIVLTGTAIRVGAQFADQYGTPINLRMGLAGVLAGFFLTGMEKLNERAGVGLAIIFFITAVSVPLPSIDDKGRTVGQDPHGFSPIETFARLWKQNAG